MKRPAEIQTASGSADRCAAVPPDSAFISYPR